MNPDDKISLRGKVWKILLQVGDIDYKNYIKLVSKGPVNNKELSETILKEKRLYAQRALRLTPDLFRRIPPEKLVRIPNALMHALRKYNLLRHIIISYVFLDRKAICDLFSKQKSFALIQQYSSQCKYYVCTRNDAMDHSIPVRDARSGCVLLLVQVLDGLRPAVLQKIPTN